MSEAQSGWIGPSYPTNEHWILILNKYQRDNLLWLLNLCGYGYAGIEPFTLANTGDWVGEIALMLAKITKSASGSYQPGWTHTLNESEGDHSNSSFGDMRKSIIRWIESLTPEKILEMKCWQELKREK